MSIGEVVTDLSKRWLINGRVAAHHLDERICVAFKEPSGLDGRRWRDEEWKGSQAKTRADTWGETVKPNATMDTKSRRRPPNQRAIDAVGQPSIHHDADRAVLGFSGSRALSHRNGQG